MNSPVGSNAGAAWAMFLKSALNPLVYLPRRRSRLCRRGSQRKEEKGDCLATVSATGEIKAHETVNTVFWLVLMWYCFVLPLTQTAVIALEVVAEEICYRIGAW